MQGEELLSGQINSAGCGKFGFRNRQFRYLIQAAA